MSNNDPMLLKRDRAAGAHRGPAGPCGRLDHPRFFAARPMRLIAAVIRSAPRRIVIQVKATGDMILARRAAARIRLLTMGEVVRIEEWRRSAFSRKLQQPLPLRRGGPICLLIEAQALALDIFFINLILSGVLCRQLAREQHRLLFGLV